jgi:hypothetical protein
MARAWFGSVSPQILIHMAGTYKTWRSLASLFVAPARWLGAHAACYDVVPPTPHLEPAA